MAMADELRKVAEQLRKVAAERPKGQQPAPPATVELDAQKVRDFLLFYGAPR